MTHGVGDFHRPLKLSSHNYKEQWINIVHNNGGVSAMIIDGNNIAPILSAIVPSIASIIVVIIQMRTNKKQKQRNDAQDQADETRKSNESRSLAMIEDQGKKIDALGTSVANLTDKMEDLQTNTQKQEKDIRKLASQLNTTTDILLRHQRATADVMNAMAEGFRDNNLNGNVTSAIESYHEIETNILIDAYKSTTQNVVDKDSK